MDTPQTMFDVISEVTGRDKEPEVDMSKIQSLSRETKTYEKVSVRKKDGIETFLQIVMRVIRWFINRAPKVENTVFNPRHHLCYGRTIHAYEDATGERSTSLGIKDFRYKRKDLKRIDVQRKEPITIGGRYITWELFGFSVTIFLVLANIILSLAMNGGG